ncbi:hypothetical protein M8J77_025424 [Diaphorina citri]|nr:hypothetical protein M8J77_025424 [Diaphorina citri]
MKVMIMGCYMLIYSAFGHVLPWPDNKNQPPTTEKNKSTRYSKLLSVTYEENSDKPEAKAESRVYTGSGFREPKFCESCNAEPWIPVVKFSQRAPKQIIYQEEPYYGSANNNHQGPKTYLSPPQYFHNSQETYSNSYHKDSVTQSSEVKTQLTPCDLLKHHHNHDSIGSGSEEVSSIEHNDQHLINHLNSYKGLPSDTDNFFRYFSYVKHPITPPKQNLLTNFTNVPPRKIPHQIHEPSRQVKQAYNPKRGKNLFSKNPEHNNLVGHNEQQTAPHQYDKHYSKDIAPQHNPYTQSPSPLHNTYDGKVRNQVNPFTNKLQPYKLLPVLSNSVSKESNLPHPTKLEIDNTMKHLHTQNTMNHHNHLPILDHSPGTDFEKDMPVQYLTPPKIPSTNTDEKGYEHYNVPNVDIHKLPEQKQHFNHENNDIWDNGALQNVNQHFIQEDNFQDITPPHNINQHFTEETNIQGITSPHNINQHFTQETNIRDITPTHNINQHFTQEDNIIQDSPPYTNQDFIKQNIQDNSISENINQYFSQEDNIIQDSPPYTNQDFIKQNNNNNQDGTNSHSTILFDDRATQLQKLSNIPLDPSQLQFDQNHLKSLSAIEWQCFLMNFIKYLKMSKAGYAANMSHECDPITLQQFISSINTNDHHMQVEDNAAIVSNEIEHGEKDYTKLSPNTNYVENENEITNPVVEDKHELVKLAPHLSGEYYVNSEYVKNYSKIAQQAVNQFIQQNEIHNDKQDPNMMNIFDQSQKTKDAVLGNQNNNDQNKKSFLHENKKDVDDLNDLANILNKPSKEKLNNDNDSYFNESFIHWEPIKNKEHYLNNQEIIENNNIFQDMLDAYSETTIPPTDNQPINSTIYDGESSTKNAELSTVDDSINEISSPNSLFYPKGFSFTNDQSEFVTEKPILLTSPKKIKIVIPYRKRSSSELRKETGDDDFHNTIDTWTADGYSNHKLTSNKFNQSTSFNALQKSKSIPLLYLNSTQANSTGSEQSNISGNVSKTWEDLTVAISPYTKERVYVVTPKSN